MCKLRNEGIFKANKYINSVTEFTQQKPLCFATERIKKKKKKSLINLFLKHRLNRLNEEICKIKHRSEANIW